MSLTLITPDSETFDSAIGSSGRVDPVTEPMSDLLRQAVESDVSVFQIGADATVPDGKGGEVTLDVKRVRRWAYEKLPTLDPSPLPAGKVLGVSGGKDGRNIQLTIKDAKAASKGK